MIEKLNFALAALENPNEVDYLCEQALDALRSVIAEMEAAEPVAWRVLESRSRYALYFHKPSADRAGEIQTPRTFPEPLYTHPQPKTEPVAWMAKSKSGNVRFTNIGISADELEKMGWKITPLTTFAAQPKAEPTKCVKCGDELMSSFTNTCYACKQKADRAPCRITTDGVCEAIECFEDEQPKKPLSVLQIRDIRDTFDKDEPISLVAFARAIEAAHGIK